MKVSISGIFMSGDGVNFPIVAGEVYIDFYSNGKYCTGIRTRATTSVNYIQFQYNGSWLDAWDSVNKQWNLNGFNDELEIPNVVAFEETNQFYNFLFGTVYQFINDYEITLDANGGTLQTPSTMYSKSNQTILAPTNPTRTNYRFLYWYTSNPSIAYDFNTPITSNITLHAKWEINEYNVTFDAKGGSPTPPTQTIDYGEVATEPTAPTKTHYNFRGWSTNEDEYKPYNFHTLVTHDINLYAFWTPVDYTVTYQNSDGSTYAELEVEYNTKATNISLPSKVGYTSLYWALNGVQFNFDTLIDSDITLTPVYSIDTYTVKFYKEGIVYDTQSVQYGNKATEPTAPTKANAEFVGWSTNANNYTAYDFNALVVSDLNLYAIFQDNGMTLNLYQCTAENNRIDKTDYLTSVGTLNGTLRGDCSIMNPSIIVESTIVPNYNYVYIEQFNRYYFVTNITTLRDKIWILNLKCDVLMSFKDNILNQVGIVERNEFEYDGTLVDPMINAQAVKDYQIIINNGNIRFDEVLDQYVLTVFNYNFKK